MGTKGTITTPVTLSLYRDRHRIVSTRDYDADLGRTVDVCAHDGIRLYAQRGRWVHDPSEIRELAALERGEGIRW
jgi:hypothetical protein